MSQRGQIFRKDNTWYLRYYDNVLENGTIRRKRVCRKLVDFGDRYRSKKSVRALAAEFLAPLNEGKLRPESTMPVAQFIERHYLPHTAEQKRPSTFKGYQDLWTIYLRPETGSLSLRDFRTHDGSRLLADIARHRGNRLPRRTLRHIKSFLSGVFTYAKNQGFLDGVNPMQNVEIPAGKGPQETYAYSLEEIQKMLALPELPERARLVIATAAFTGLRKSELRGVRWEDYRDGALHVSQAVWGRHVNEPKTERSKAPVPVISLLAEMLDRQRRQTGPIFRASNGQPLNLHNLANRVLKPALAVNQMKWHGWHAFRRGLATNLNRLGVDPKTIQAILRHSNLATTMNIYVKAVQPDAVEAMRRLDASFQNRLASKLPN